MKFVKIAVMLLVVTIAIESVIGDPDPVKRRRRGRRPKNGGSGYNRKLPETPCRLLSFT